MRARQKVRQEGEKMFVTPKTSLSLPFLTRQTTWKPQSHLSRNSLYALLVTHIRHTCTDEVYRIGGDKLGGV